MPFTISTMSIRSIEDRAERTDRPFWFRLYLLRDRAFDDRPIDRTRIAPDAVIRGDNDPITIGGDG